MRIVAPVLLLCGLLVTSLDTTASAGGSRPADRLPPDEETAKQRLDTTPRHGEYVDVKMADGTPIRTFVSYPERSDKAGVVILVHEIYGLSDWMRGVADQLAAEGFIAVAPDLVSGMGPNGGGTESAASRDDVVKMVRALTPEVFAPRFAAVRDWAVKLPASNGRFATIGFCWGGGQSFALAAVEPLPAAAVVYYGVSPDSATLPAVRAPVQGHYGGDDARVNATIPAAQKVLEPLHRTYEVHIYPGAGHGFLRQQSGRDGANQKATRQAWPRTVAFLKKYLK